MFFENYYIFVYIALFTILYNSVRFFTNKTLIKNIFIALGNTLILLTLVKEHTIIVLAVFSLIVYILGKLISNKSNKTILLLSITLIIAIFSFRNYPFLSSLIESTVIHKPIFSVQKIGLSYILFRYIHWLAECYKQTIQKSNFLSFINYILFFPTILSGPIDTYKNYNYWQNKKNNKYDISLFFSGIAKIFFGAIKTIGITPFIVEYATNYETLLGTYSFFPALALSSICYSLYIYFNFSGYSDIAIGTSYLLGIKITENFNNPYFATNLSDFWKRWHISFSEFLKLYVFKPTINILNKTILNENKTLVTITCYLVTFIICGLWHGETLNFIIWGLWHGIGLSINKLWTNNFPDHFKGKFYLVSSRVLTFCFVTVGWIFFHYNIENLTTIFLNVIE